jgi:hypothetical protein
MGGSLRPPFSGGGGGGAFAYPEPLPRLRQHRREARIVDVVWLFLFTSIYLWGGWGAPHAG